MARRPVTAPITGPSDDRRMQIPAFAADVDLSFARVYEDMAALAYNDDGLQGRVGGLETALDGLSGLPARVTAAETSITALSTANTALNSRVTALENAGGGGGGAADPGAIERFGGVMSVFPVLTPPSQAVMEANYAALVAAFEWSRTTGGVVQLGYGILYIWGAATMPLGASINGKGIDASRLQQGNLPQNASTPWLDVLACPAVSGSTGGNGYNNITNLTIDGGWNRRSYIGDTAAVWTYPANRMTAAGLRVATPTGGPSGASAFREQGTDAHVRVQNVLFQNIAGHGYHMTGRGENFMVMIEIRLCANGFYLNSPDCFATLHTVYTIGDTGGEITAGGGNFRFSDSKLWFCGMTRGYEPVGAGLVLSSPGGQGYGIRNVDTQDTFGPGVVIAGDSNIVFEGFIDEAGGGRLEEQGFGWQGARTLPRCYVRLNGTSRRARLAVQIRGGARNGVGNYPFLAHLAGSAMEFNRIQFEGPLSGINMTTGTITGASYANGIVLANGLTNGSSPRYNEIRHGFRLLYGALTAAEMANAAHPVNDALYGPDAVTMTSNLPAWRRPYGGWYRLDEMFRPITRAAYAALPTAEQNDPFYNFAFTD